MTRAALALALTVALVPPLAAQQPEGASADLAERLEIYRFLARHLGP